MEPRKASPFRQELGGCCPLLGGPQGAHSDKHREARSGTSLWPCREGSGRRTLLPPEGENRVAGHCTGLIHVDAALESPAPPPRLIGETSGVQIDSLAPTHPLQPGRGGRADPLKLIDVTPWEENAYGQTPRVRRDSDPCHRPRGSSQRKSFAGSPNNIQARLTGRPESVDGHVQGVSKPLAAPPANGDTRMVSPRSRPQGRSESTSLPSCRSAKFLVLSRTSEPTKGSSRDEPTSGRRDPP